jgi:hypothetical protein
MSNPDFSELLDNQTADEENFSPKDLINQLLTT